MLRTSFRDFSIHPDLSPPPDVVWTLIPAVAATLKNTVFAFRLIKKLRLNVFTLITIQKLPLLVCVRVSMYASYKFVKVLEGSWKRRSEAQTKKGSLRETSPID